MMLRVADIAKLHVEEVPIEQLTPHPKNYRTHPDDQIEHIMASIQEHGFYRPIVVAQDDTILPDGSLLLPRDCVGEWVRHMETSYDDLSEEDKEKDRDIVRTMFAFVVGKEIIESMELGRFDDDGGCVTS